MKNYPIYIEIMRFFSLLFACFYYYKYFGQPNISYNSGPDPFGLPPLGPDPFASLVRSIESGEITRIPLPCTHYTELNPGMYRVTGGAQIEIFKRDSASPTKLVGIHIPDPTDPDGTNTHKALDSKQVGCALYELRDKGVSVITSGNTRRTPEINEFVRAHTLFRGFRPTTTVTISNRLIDDLVDMRILKQN